MASSISVLKLILVDGTHDVVLVTFLRPKLMYFIENIDKERWGDVIGSKKKPRRELGLLVTKLNKHDNLGGGAGFLF